MIYYLSLVLGLLGAFLLLGTLLGRVQYANALLSMIWSAASAVAIIWALNTLGVFA